MNSLTQKTSGIYQICNTINGHCYIGSSVDIQHRWSDHKHRLRKGVHHSQYLQRAFNKYGEDAFEFSVIETCLVPVLILREQYYIDKLNPEYNIVQTAGSALGMKHTDAARKKMSVAKTGLMVGYKHTEQARANMSIAARNMTPEHKKKISDTHKGMGHTKETRAKLSEIVKGYMTPEHRARLSEAHKGQKPSTETIAKRKISLIAAWVRRKAKKNE